jgi:hypothetical protein
MRFEGRNRSHEVENYAGPEKRELRKQGLNPIWFRVAGQDDKNSDCTSTSI